MSTTATTTTVMRPAPSSSTSTTVLESLARQQQQTLTLRLNRPKKKVSWKEDTVDNEYMQKKSSKICCIFHKEKPFDEDDSDDDDDCNHDHKSDGCGALQARATDISKEQPKHATPHPEFFLFEETLHREKYILSQILCYHAMFLGNTTYQAHYLHAPLTMSEDELVNLLGGENSVDLLRWLQLCIG